MRTRQRLHRSFLASGAFAAAIAVSGAAVAAHAGNPTVTDVRIERAKPAQEKHPTLRFLKENRGFLRARLDLLREKPIAARDQGGALDPRHLAFQAMLTAIDSAHAATAAAAQDRDRRELIDHIAELTALERELDAMEQLITEQRARLGALEEDFTGRQETALMVLVSGYPSKVGLRSIAIKDEDGHSFSIELSEEQHEVLRQGGVVQVLHRFVEPREQVFEVSVAGDAWPTGDHGFLTLEPERNRLTFLRLDVANLTHGQGALGIHASAWPHDAPAPSSDG